jgi:hypothetical protein
VDTLIHLECWVEAWMLAEEILAVEPANDEAWTAKGDVLEERQQWSELLQLCSAWEAVAVEATWDRRWHIACFRAVAYCALENWDEMDRWLEVRAGSSDGAKRLRRWAFRRAGKTMPKAEEDAKATGA